MLILFRSLILISLISYVIYWTLPFYDYQWMNDIELDALNYHGYNSIIPSSNIINMIPWTIFVLWIISYIGIFLYINMFRHLFFILFIMDIMLVPFWGLGVFPSSSLFFINITISTTGALLIMLYCTTVGDKFQK